MKSTIIKFGLISGGISIIFLIAVTLILKYQGYEVGFDNSAYFGYGSIIIAMSAVYFGIKAQRNVENNSSFTFLKGFGIGVGIVLISCVMYSLAWLVIYYNFIPNFMNEYAQFCVKKATEAGVTPDELKKTVADVNQMKDWYKNPALVFLITMTEPLPVGLLVALVSALLLRRK